MSAKLRLIFAYAVDVLSKCPALRDVQPPMQGHEESGLTIFVRPSIYVWPVPKRANGAGHERHEKKETNNARTSNLSLWG